MFRVLLCLLAIAIAPSPARSLSVTTYSLSDLAGGACSNGLGCLIDGAKRLAGFSAPVGLASDPISANIFIADGNAIRCLDPSTGTVTSLAGGMASGYADGTGTAALFYAPAAVAISNGILLIADTSNNRIRRISALTPSMGVVTTLAGSGAGSHVDGMGTVAAFFSPRGLAADGQGGAFVADYDNHLIRRVNASGGVTTLAKNGVATAFSYPTALWMCGGGSGPLVVAEATRLCSVSMSSADVTILAGGATYGVVDGKGLEALFVGPSALAADDTCTELFVADSSQNYGAYVRVVTLATSSVVTLLSSPTQGRSFSGLAVTATTGDGSTLVISDKGNALLRVLAAQPTPSSRRATTGSSPQ